MAANNDGMRSFWLTALLALPAWAAPALQPLIDATPIGGEQFRTFVAEIRHVARGVGLQGDPLRRQARVSSGVFRRAEGGDDLVTATVQIVCVKLDAMKTTPIPEFLREKLEALQ